MDTQDRAGLSMNDSGTCGEIDPPLTQTGSQDVRKRLNALRTKHGAKSPIGHRCSNIVELLKQPEPPAHLIQRQMKELEQLLAAR